MITRDSAHQLTPAVGERSHEYWSIAKVSKTPGIPFSVDATKALLDNGLLFSHFSALMLRPVEELLLSRTSSNCEPSVAGIVRALVPRSMYQIAE